MNGSVTPTPFPLSGSVLITGASGFLGNNLSARLVRAGLAVHATSRSERSSSDDRIRWWRLAMEDARAVQQLVNEIRPDVIVHLSGLANGAPDMDLVSEIFHSQVTSTVNLLTAATSAGCGRVVCAGSLEEPRSAEPESVPASPYGAAKCAASAYARMFHRVYGTPVVIARTFMTYGPGQPGWKVIPSTIRALLEGRAPRLSHGARHVDWIYVDDVIEGLIRCGGTSGLEGMTVDLGSGTMTTIREVVTRLVALIDPSARPEFGALPERPSEDYRVADIRRTFALLGWQPSIPLDEGLPRTVDWYRSHGSSTDTSPQRLPAAVERWT